MNSTFPTVPQTDFVDSLRALIFSLDIFQRRAGVKLIKQLRIDLVGIHVAVGFDVVTDEVVILKKGQEL